MKTSFSRNFFTAAAILLLALTALGGAFQLQVNRFMEDTTVSGLQQDSAIIANLAAAYSMDGKLTSKELLLNLDVISQVTDADVVICDHNGYIILCSDALTGCDHEGWQVNQEYLQAVYENGSQTATGVIGNLYADERYIVTSPIVDSETLKGIVIASTPTAATSHGIRVRGAAGGTGGDRLCPPGEPSSSGYGQSCQCLCPRQSEGPC